MNDIKETIRAEWEIYLSGTLLLLCFAVSVMLFFAGEPTDTSGTGGNSGQSVQPLLSDNAFDFLHPNAPLDNATRNPFRSPLQPPPQPPVEPRRPKPTPPKPPVAIVTPPAVAATAEPTVVAELPPKPPTPQPVYCQRQLTFTYHQQDNSGKSVALLKWATSTTEAEMRTLTIGDCVDGITIIAIATDQVKVQDAYGKNVYLQFGKPRVVIGKKNSEKPK